MATEAERRRQAEEEARTSGGAWRETQRLIGRILDITPGQVYIYDLAERRNVYANRAAASFLGYSPEQLRNLGPDLLQNILHPDDAPRVAEHFACFGSDSGDAVREIECRIKHADGHWRWLRSRHTVFLRDENGAARRILGAAEDVTERKWNETSHEAMVAMLRLLNAPNETREMIRTLTGFLQEWSGCEAVGVRLREGDAFPYYETRGFPAGMLKSAPENGEAPAGECCPASCLCSEVLKGTGPSQPHFTENGSFWMNSAADLAAVASQVPYLGRAGGRRHLEGWESAALIPLRYAGRTFGLIQVGDRAPGRLNTCVVLLLERVAAGLAGALQHRLTQTALRASEERYRLISENTEDVIWLFDPAARRITFITPSVERLLGYAPEEAIALGPAGLLTPDSHQFAMKRMEEMLAACAAGDYSLRTQNNQMEHVRKDGSIVRVEMVTKLLGGGGEAPCQILGVTRDLTDRLQAEARLAQAQKMESVGRLAGGVAHDFNNLLTVINGYAQMLLADAPPHSPLYEGIDEIRKAGERAAGLTAQLLAFSRKQVLQPKPLDLNSVVGAIHPMLARMVGEDVEVSVALSPRPCMVRADPHQLEQAIMNLAVNARDAMPLGGKLLFETAAVEWDAAAARLHSGARPGRYCMLAVSDTGIGMDEATRARVFEPFFTTKGLGKGTGLGLSTVQGIVAQSGGHIEVYSEAGAGSTFKIYLPCIAGAAAPSRQAQPAPLRGSEAILVVEDQEEVRDFIAAALESFGYRVLKARDAAEALAICAPGGPAIHLVLTDVVMPGVQGLQLAERLGVVRPGLRIVFMSGYTDNAVLQQGGLGPGADFIMKPFTAGQLAARVRAALERRD